MDSRFRGNDGGVARGNDGGVARGGMAVHARASAPPGYSAGGSAYGTSHMGIWKETVDLDRINAWSAGSMIEHLGMRITEVGEDYLRGTMPVDRRTTQPFGLLHGGASVALAESLGSLGGTLCLDATTEMAVGLDINANHVRAMTEGVVTGTARPLHLGRSTQVWEIRIEDERGRLVCISRLTLAVVPRAAPRPV
jgi:1,4-dihydroxy-2-naphthoyl-CoA hydrolase